MHSGWYPDYRQPQLFKKDQLKYSMDAVHETYIPSPNAQVGHLSCPIWQIPFASLSEMMDKANRYSTLGVERAASKIRHPSMWKALRSSVWSFVRRYIIKRGFLDGWAGLTIALGEAYGAYFRYAKYYEQEHQWPGPPHCKIYRDHTESITPTKQ